MSYGQNPLGVESIPLDLLRRYLQASGWRLAQKLELSAESLASFSQPVAEHFLRTRKKSPADADLYILDGDRQAVEVLVPNSTKQVDFAARMSGVLTTLSYVEQRAPEVLLEEIRSVGFDLVRTKIPDEFVTNETISLAVAGRYVNDVRTLLATAATSEIKPSPFFSRIRRTAAEYAEQCRFGHTFRGSFGFTVESPVASNDQPTFSVVEATFPPADGVPPFGRRVVQRLAYGLQTVDRALLRQDVSIIMNATDRGLNANTCEQLARLVEETCPSGLSFTFSLSPEWKPQIELARSMDFSVGPRHVEIMRAAAKELRDRPFSRPEQLRGRVIQLSSQDDPTNLYALVSEREVVIKWESEDLGEIDVRVTLSPLDYLQAVDAHRFGRPVIVGGTLERVGRSWVLREPDRLMLNS